MVNSTHEIERLKKRMKATSITFRVHAALFGLLAATMMLFLIFNSVRHERYTFYLALLTELIAVIFLAILAFYLGRYHRAAFVLATLFIALEAACFSPIVMEPSPVSLVAFSMFVLALYITVSGLVASYRYHKLMNEPVKHPTPTLDGPIPPPFVPTAASDAPGDVHGE